MTAPPAPRHPLVAYLAQRGVGAPVRLAVFLIVAALVMLVGAPLRMFAQARGWRIGAGLPALFHRAVCRALDVRLRVHGEASALRPQLVVVNHVSWLDIVMLGAMRPTQFLAKKEVGDGALARALVGLQGVAFVDRGKRRKIPAVNAEMARRMLAGAPLVLFAEATTSDGNRLLPFRSSHFQAPLLTLPPGGPLHSAIIQPLYIVYSRRNGLPLGRAERPLVAWYGDMPFYSHLWRFLRAGPVDCDIHCGAPIYVHRPSDRKTLARRAEAAVRALARQAHGAGAPAPARAILGGGQTS